MIQCGLVPSEGDYLSTGDPQATNRKFRIVQIGNPVIITGWQLEEIR